MTAYQYLLDALVFTQQCRWLSERAHPGQLTFRVGSTGLLVVDLRWRSVTYILDAGSFSVHLTRAQMAVVDQFITDVVSSPKDWDPPVRSYLISQRTLGWSMSSSVRGVEPVVYDNALDAPIDVAALRAQVDAVLLDPNYSGVMSYPFGVGDYLDHTGVSESPTILPTYN